jgi:hypothetical protein
MDHRNVAEDAVDIDVHFLLGKVLDELHVSVSDCVHEGVPVVRSIELVDEMRESIEKIDDLLGLAFLYFITAVPIQQNILVT